MAAISGTKAVSKAKLIYKAVRAREAYEYSFQHGYPTAYINKREREYTAALKALVDHGFTDARDFVADYGDCQPDAYGNDGQKEAVAM